MSVYIIANISIHDGDEYEKYQAGFGEIFARYEGELLAVSDEPQIIEGEWPHTRAVVIRFPNADEARRWYSSSEYQEIAKHRRRASKASIIALEGLQ